MKKTVGISELGAPSLGVVAICFNEERDLPGFLDNLLSWVDEVVIVDDGSTDGSKTIALAAGSKVKFLESARQAGEYFSHQRNKGIESSSSSWLLHMDIDERVSPELATEIRTAIRDPDRDGYNFRRRNYFLHRAMRGGGWCDWNLVHIARREKLKFGGMYHEKCLVDANVNRIGQLIGEMIHLNEATFEQRITKSNLYVEERVRELEKRGKRIGGRDLVLMPVLEFSKKFVAKYGFVDGVPGLIAALHSATAVFRAYAIMWDRQNRIPREIIERKVCETVDGEPSRQRRTR